MSEPMQDFQVSPETLSLAVEEGRRGIEASEGYKRPWHEPASAYGLSKAAVLAAAPLIREEERKRLVLSEPFGVLASTIGRARLRLQGSLAPNVRAASKELDDASNALNSLRDIAPDTAPQSQAEFRLQIEAEVRERLGSEETRRAIFETVTEGNFLSFTDPEGQEEYVWSLVDAITARLLRTPIQGDRG